MDLPILPVALVCLGLALLTRRSSRKPTFSLPPGPPGIPVLGNLLQVPSTLLFLKIHEWYERYGVLYSYNLAGKPVVVISGWKEAADLLDRMSAKTSDRPEMIKVNEFLTRQKDFAFQARNDSWRTQRRGAHNSLNVRAAQAFQPIQAEETQIMLNDLLHHPEVDIFKHLYRHSASIAWRVLYGHDSIPLLGDDPAAFMHDFFKELMVAVMPGGSIVDIFPFLTPIISRSKWLRRQSDMLYEKATKFFVTAHTDPQVDGPSLSSALKETGERIGMSAAVDCGWLSGSLFFAAQDTTATTLKWFFVAMLNYPESARAAREQLDRVVGNRLPTYDDWEQLPQIEAMVKELVRWRPVAPLSVAHMTAEDIQYDQYLIPKGTILIPNLWDMCRDPQLYANGEAFDPSRFIDEKGGIKSALADTHDDYIGFGHGRRICIGKTLAINTLWITIAQVLWAFEIVPAKDKDGKEIVPDPNAFLDNGATLWPQPYPYKLVPRFPDLAERLKERAVG